MKLYISPGACSLAPHILLNEAGIAHETIKVDLRAKTYAGGDFKKINPKGQVPTLELDDGKILTENAVILQYIADQKPEAQLLPKFGTWERYRALEWGNYVATELHKGFSPLFNPKTPDDFKQIVRDGLKGKAEYIDQHLGDRQFLMGQQYTIADAYMFTILSWAKPNKIDLSPFKALSDYLERVRSRPATQTTLKQEGLA